MGKSSSLPTHYIYRSCSVMEIHAIKITTHSVCEGFWTSAVIDSAKYWQLLCTLGLGTQ